MKRLMAFLLLAGALSAAPYPRIRRGSSGFNGAETLFAGYRSFFFFKPLYGFDFTCVTATDVCTAGNGYTPVNGDLIVMDSTGTLPSGLETVQQWHWPTYCVANASGSTFKVQQYQYPAATCSGVAVDITTTGAGTHTAMVYNYNSGARIYIFSTSGLPPGSTIDWYVSGTGNRCNALAPTSGGKPYAIGGGEPEGEGVLCPRVNIPIGTADGTTGTWVITTSELADGTNSNTFSWDYIIKAATFTPTPASSFSPVSWKSTWVSLMTAGVTGGDELGMKTYCLNQANPAETYDGGVEAGPQYPLAGEPYLNRRKYLAVLPDECGIRMAGPERDYIVSNGGSIPQYKQWAEPMFRAWRDYNDSTYYDAALLLQNTAELAFGAFPMFGYDRENAYGLWSADAIKKYSGIANTYISDLRDTLIMFMNRYTETDVNYRGESQVFYSWIVCHVLIYDYIYNGQDPRIPIVIKKWAARAQATYNTGTHTQMWSTGADAGPWCLNFITWFWNDPLSGCQVHTGQKLNAYSAGTFAWLFAITGDTTYRDNGDDWMLHNFDAGIYTGKEIAEAYFDSFQALAWREGSQSYLQWYGDSGSNFYTRPGARVVMRGVKVR